MIVLRCYLFHAGLSKAVADLLRTLGMSGTGPHEFSLDTGAASIFVHPLLDIRGSNCLRWATESLYRSVRFRDTALQNFVTIKDLAVVSL